MGAQLHWLHPLKSEFPVSCFSKGILKVVRRGYVATSLLATIYIAFDCWVVAVQPYSIEWVVFRELYCTQNMTTGIIFLMRTYLLPV